MKAIINAELVLLDHMMPEAVLFIEAGKIKGFGEMRTTPIPDGCEIIDAEGEYVAPGFVDIHCHASGGVFYHLDPAWAVSNSLRHGATTLLPTLAYEYSLEEYLTYIRRIMDFSRTPEGASIGGMYMEGPYTNQDFGSNRGLHPYGGDIKKEMYQPLIDLLGGFVRVWCVAPEREGIEAFVADAKRTNPMVHFAVGHSRANPAQIEKLMPYGLSIGTHHTNATGDLPKYPECRGVCVDETVNYQSGIYAEIISDKRGIHVDPYMQRLVRKIKGDERIILITDGSFDVGPVPAHGYEGVDDLWFDKDGEISGSKLTMDAVCRNWMKHTGASFCEAFRAAAYNPATAVGFMDRGEIAEGKRADLVIVDRHINIKQVFLEGEKVQDGAGRPLPGKGGASCLVNM